MMKNRFARRLIGIAALICITACSSMTVDEHAATERINHIVEDVRKAASIGFIDVTINYVEPNLNISGQTYSSSHVVRLMRSVNSPNLTLIDLTKQNFEGTPTVGFRLSVADVGSIRKWGGSITLKFPLTTDPAVLTSDMLGMYPLNDYLFIAATGKGQQRRATIRFPDGSSLPLREGTYIGKERALISEINENSVMLLEQSGAKHVLRRADGVSDK